jgi:hypothetical protein
MPLPTPNDVHVDRPLTDISVAFIQSADGFVANKVFPTIPVARQSNKYFTWDRNNFFLDMMEKRPPASESAGGAIEKSTDSYACDVFALHKDIDDQTRANDDEGNLDTAAAKYLAGQNLIRMDRQFATDYFAINIWTTDVVGDTNFTKWSDGASNPELDIMTGKKTMLTSTGFLPNTLVVGFAVHQALKRHPAIKDQIKYTSAGSITNEIIARHLEIDNYVVSAAAYATNDEGASSDTQALIQGDNALLCFSNPSPGLMEPSAGYIFAWTGLTGLNSNGVTTSRFRIPEIKSDRIEIESAFDMKVVSADLGYFFSDAAD